MSPNKGDGRATKDMKILLSTLNSKYAHSNPALKCLYMTAKDSGADISIREFTINNDKSYVYSEIVLSDADMVCFSCYVWNISMILELCSNLKKAKPNMKILLGGPEVSYEAIDMMSSHKFIDFIIQGEGEETFAELAGVLVKRFNAQYANSPEGQNEFDLGTYVIALAKIKGLIYRQDGRIFVNPPRENVDFQALEFPYNYFPCEEDKVIYYESSRGCPYSCSYCMSSIEKGIRMLPVDRVKSELGYFLTRKVAQVKLLDRTFNCDPERAKEIWRYLIVGDNGITNFHFEICADLLDEEAMFVLKDARKGLFQFEIGVQSINDETIKAVNRTSNFAKLSENVRKLMEMGNITVHLDLIAGLPYENLESFAHSFDAVYALRPDALQLGFLKLLKGTAIRDAKDEFDYVFRDEAPYEIISNRFITAKELAHLKRIENVFDLYYNRKGFSGTLDLLLEETGLTPFGLFWELTGYYCLQGWQHRSHSKEEAYRMLYKFALWKAETTEGLGEKARQALETDMETYLNFDAIKKFKRKGWNIL